MLRHAMKPAIVLLTVVLLAPPLWLRGDEPTARMNELEPGARIILRFPDLPRSLFAMQSGEEAMTQACLVLPDNYSAERTFPLFVFLYGGHGGPAAGPGRGHQIMKGRDCIFVNLPLFKAAFDPAGPFKGLLITTEQDGDAICRAYAAMLEKINATVPNIDSTRNVIGGMSNGAHSIVAMFEKGDDRLRGMFRHLVLIEGGWYSIKAFDRYREKSILYLCGDYADQDDWLGRRMREDLPQARRKLEEAAHTHRLDVTGLVMQGTGHDMPTRFDADVRAWVLKQFAR